MRVTTYEIEQNNGIPYLVKENSVNYNAASHSDRKLNNSSKVFWLMKDVLKVDRKAEEHVWIFGLDNSCKLLGVFDVFKGSVNQCISSPREIFLRLLLSGASSFIMAHNHTSDETEPSRLDLETTKKMDELSKMMGIRLMDHVITGGETYYSFADNGLIK